MFGSLVRSSAIAIALAAAAACRPVMPLIGGQSLSVGEWSGTTSQGMPIEFTVDENELLTTITLGHDFNGCTGTQTFTNLSIRTAPEVVCLPGPCRGFVTSSRSFGFLDASTVTGPNTQINGVFLPRDQARGQAVFRNFPMCGDATVEWSATRQ